MHGGRDLLDGGGGVFVVLRGFFRHARKLSAGRKDLMGVLADARDDVLKARCHLLEGLAEVIVVRPAGHALAELALGDLAGRLADVLEICGHFAEALEQSAHFVTGRDVHILEDLASGDPLRHLGELHDGPQNQSLGGDVQGRSEQKRHGHVHRDHEDDGLHDLALDLVL